MAVTDTPTKYLCYSEVKKTTGLELNEQQLVIIENVYIKSRKNNIFRIGMFRFFNASFAFIFILIFWYLKGSDYSEWIFVRMMVVFFIYNTIHFWNCLVDYKRTKLDTFKPFKVGK